MIKTQICELGLEFDGEKILFQVQHENEARLELEQISSQTVFFRFINKYLSSLSSQ